MLQQIDDDLKMKVRRPAAVFVDVANASELLATRDALADLDSVKGFAREMAEQRKKLETVARCVMKNHERAVIERSSIDRDSVDHTFKWRVDRCAGSGEQVYP